MADSTPQTNDLPSVVTPPMAERRPVVLEAHGDVRTDDWFWLRDKDDPEVIAHLDAENAWTAAAMAHTEALQATLYEEMVARIEETDLSVPVKKGPWLYYGRTREGANYGIHCRRPVDGSEDGEQVILDENVLAEGYDYFGLANVAVSPNHQWLAYATDVTGGERYTLTFRDLESGERSAEQIEDTSYGIAWANDNATVFYVRVDEAMRPFQLWKHRVGTDPATDSLVRQEDDDRFYLGVGGTRDDAFILCSLDSKVTSEVWVLDADDPDGTFRVIEPRRQGVEYAVDHVRAEPTTGQPGRFLIVTNDEAEDFRLMAAPEETPGRDHWIEVNPSLPGVRLDGVDPFAGHVVIYERHDGSTRIRVVDHQGNDRTIEQPESPSTVWAGANPEYDTGVLRYEYTSLTTPRSVYDLDLADGSLTLRKRQPVLGDFDPTHYRTERRWATAPDGTQVPISLVWRPDLVRAPGADGRGLAVDGGAPCLLYGYGSYEASMDPTFSSLRLSLLDRGVIFAIAHVRGGGELGRQWYENGKFAAKPNTFTDFVACARTLIDQGWTSPDRLAARGGSAGGLLMGAVANLAPELFRAVIAEVPFVDCLTTILDDTLPLTVLEWEEWGNPVEDPEIYAVMKSYSPYDNVAISDAAGQPVRYPSILATGGLSDPRVGFWEPAKWVAKLRAANPDNQVLLKMEMGAGHGGPSGRYDAWKDEAFVYAFLLDALAMADVAPVPYPTVASST